MIKWKKAGGVRVCVRVHHSSRSQARADERRSPGGPSELAPPPARDHNGWVFHQLRTKPAHSGRVHYVCDRVIACYCVCVCADNTLLSPPPPPETEGLSVVREGELPVSPALLGAVCLEAESNIWPG